MCPAPSSSGGHRAVRFRQSWHQKRLSPEVTPQTLDFGVLLWETRILAEPTHQTREGMEVAFSWFRSVGLNHLGISDSFETTKITGLSPRGNTCITFLHRILGAH